MRRVTFVVTAEALGGGELYLLRFAKALSKQVPVRLVGRVGTPIVQEAYAYGLPVEGLNLGRKLGMRTALYDISRFPVARRRLDKLMRQAPGDVFVFQYKWEQLLWGARHSNDRVILWEHGPIPAGVLKVAWSRHRLLKAYRCAHEVFAMSVPARESVHELSGRVAELLPAGLDLNACMRARSLRDQTRKDLVQLHDQKILGFVGRVTEDKGILRAIAMLESSPELTLIVCGEGPARALGEQLAQRLGVADRIRWLGWRADALDIVAAVDAVLLLSTSHGEGRPLIALESLAVGTPVIGLAGTPALEIMGREPGVYLASSRQPEAIAEAIAAAFARQRPEPSGSDWGSSVALFLDSIEDGRVETGL